MSIPKDMTLYNKIREQVKKDIPKHSAYRSGTIVKKYKNAYRKKHGNSAPYKGVRNPDGGLSLWFKSKWRNQRGGVGYKKKGDVYRPTVRVNKKTPKTFKQLTKSQIMKAMMEKRKTGRVKKFDK